MSTLPPTRPLPQRHRRYTFLLLLGLFMVAIPLLYLYATGYRYDFTGKNNFISTGGIFIGAERTGAEIYIDSELVRETRVFRRAFYAQNLDPGTHRVHVQRPGSHTWVKELPVYPHLVTEAQAFNLPIVPEARIISEWNTKDGEVVAPMPYILRATTTQEFFFASTTATTTYALQSEYRTRLELFEPATTTPVVKPITPVRAGVEKIESLLATTTATTTEEVATTTKEQNGVRLFQDGEDVYAEWVGLREGMPYYYCAEPFEAMATNTVALSVPVASVGSALVAAAKDPVDLTVQVQEVPLDAPCVPEIRIDRKWQKVNTFDFFPGSTDLVIMGLEKGIYAVEVDDRAWQNVQPLMEGEGLRVRVDAGRIYIYDGTLIYEMIVE